MSFPFDAKDALYVIWSLCNEISYSSQYINRLPILFSGPDNPQIWPFPWEFSTPNYCMISLDPRESAHPPNGISIGSAVFEYYIGVTSTQTHRPRYV